MCFFDSERTTFVNETDTFRISAEGSEKRPNGVGADLARKWPICGEHSIRNVSLVRGGQKGVQEGVHEGAREGVREEVQDQVREEILEDIREGDHQKCLDVKTQIRNS